MNGIKETYSKINFLNFCPLDFNLLETLSPKVISMILLYSIVNQYKKCIKIKLQIIENGRANCESSFLSKKIISFQRSDNFVQLSCIYTLKLHSRFLICAKKHNFTHTYLQRHKRVYNHVYISLMQKNHTSFMNLHRGIENTFFFPHHFSADKHAYVRRYQCNV